MNNSLNILNRKIIKCTKCDRLVKFRKKIAKEKRKLCFQKLKIITKVAKSFIN